MSSGMYYSFTINTSGTNSSAYYSINFDRGITTFQSGFSFLPAATQSTYAAVYPSQVGLNLPPMSILAGGVTLTTTVDHVTGEVMVSPAVNVPVVFELWGVSMIGSVTLQPGDTSALFNFDITHADGFADTDGARAVIDRLAPKP